MIGGAGTPAERERAAGSVTPVTRMLASSVECFPAAACGGCESLSAAGSNEGFQ